MYKSIAYFLLSSSVIFIDLPLDSPKKYAKRYNILALAQAHIMLFNSIVGLRPESNSFGFSWKLTAFNLKSRVKMVKTEL